MADLSLYLRDKLYDHVLRNIPYTSPDAVYVRAFSAVTDALEGTGTEITEDGYAPQLVTFIGPDEGAGQSTADVVFGPAEEDWTPIVAVGLFDGDGNPLSKLKDVTSTTVETGDSFRLPTADLTALFT